MAASESSAGAIVGENLAGIITSWNERAHEVYGYSAAEVVGGSSSVLIPIDRQQEASEIGARLRRGDAVENYETARLRKCGERIAVCLTMYPVKEAGQVVGISTVTRDISDTKLPEGTLKWQDVACECGPQSAKGSVTSECECAGHSGVEGENAECACARRFHRQEAEFRAIFEHAGIGMALVVADGRSIRCNPALQHMMGYSEEELCNLDIKQFTHPEDFGKSQSLFAELIEGKRDQFTLEKRYIRKDGEIVYGRLTASVVRTDSGEPKYCVGMVEDITAHKLAERGLLDSAQRLELFVEQSPLAVIGWDLNFRVTEWNPSAERIFGYSKQEMLQRELWLLMPDEHHPPRNSIHTEVLGQSANCCASFRSGAIESRTKDGRTILCEWRMSPLVDSNGHVIGALALSEDVTAQRKLEEQFRQAQKMEAIGRLAGGVAHDFNNLLNVIIGYTHLLQREPISDKARENATEILKASERATALTRQLLVFSRKQVLQLRTVDVNGIVSGIAKMLRRLIGEDVELIIQLADDLAPVRADAGQIDQVIMNLAVNARDAMPQGGQLTIATSKAELSHASAADKGLLPGKYTVMTVSDNGHGMNADTLSHIFEPFFTTKEPGKGTGLGLASVHGVVKQSGGSIFVHSRVGVGTTFSIYLPATEQHVVAGPETQPIVRSAVIGGAETILLVEDEPSLRRLTKELLSAGGYKVLEAENGHAAIEVAASYDGPIPLLVTDMVMPGMHGRELAKHIRERRPRIKVLFVTGYADADVPTDERTGMLEKPFAPDVLLRKVHEVLSTPDAITAAPAYLRPA